MDDLSIDLGSIGQTGLYIYAADIFPIRPNENNNDHNQTIDFMLTLTYVLSKKLSLKIPSKSVLTNSSGLAIFVCYNQVNLCIKMTTLT